MGIEDPKVRFAVLIVINVLVLALFRYWTLNGSVFFWLREGLPSG